VKKIINFNAKVTEIIASGCHKYDQVVEKGKNVFKALKAD